MKRSEIAFGLLRIPVDFLMTLLAFVAAFNLRTVTNLIPGITLELDIAQLPTPGEYFLFSVAAAILLFIIFAANGMYSLKSSVKTSKETARVIILTAAWFMIIIAYFFVIRELPFSRLILGYSWILTALFVSIGRILIYVIQYLFLKAGIGRRRVAFIGLNDITRELYETFNKDHHFRVIGIIDDHEPKDSSIKFLGNIKELRKLIKIKNIEEIIQTKSNLSKADAEDILDFCRQHHIQYNFVPDLVQVQRTNIEISSPAGIPLISLKPTPLDGWGKVIKRLSDIVGSLIGLIIFSPIFLIVAIAIKLDSKGTVIFKYLDDGSRVKRVGQFGELFNFYKFRSMYPKTHNLRYTKLANKNTRKGTPMVKIKDDPRVTQVGKYIRKWSIDELPQLWNVLIGDMSLVGPRPHLPEEVENYKDHHKFALTIKPGVSGLAQVAGRSDLDFEKEIKLDSYYIENWSLWLDIKIVIKTFLVVFRAKAAHDV